MLPLKSFHMKSLPKECKNIRISINGRMHVDDSIIKQQYHFLLEKKKKLTKSQVERIGQAWVLKFQIGPYLVVGCGKSRNIMRKFSKSDDYLYQE